MSVVEKPAKSSLLPEAVLIVFQCQDEIYLIRRQNYLMAFPGHHSFPGGKVDAEDRAAIADELLTLPLIEAASFPHSILTAVHRELTEEVHFDMINCPEDRAQVISIRQIGVATTPPFNPYRFKTFFIKIELKNKIAFQTDEQEVAHGEWSTIDAIIKNYESGNFLFVPPLVTLLKALKADAQLTHIPILDLTYDENTEVPCIESLYGIRQMPVLSHTLPPFDRTNAFLIGDDASPETGKKRKRVLIDPSPHSEEEKEKLKNVVNKYGVDEIFITHSHPDHHEYACDLAREYGIPLALSRDTLTRITQWHQQRQHKLQQNQNQNENESTVSAYDHWKDVTIKHYQQGDVLTTWLGEDVIVYELPGHDEGQLGLAPTSLKWFLVGDLIQGKGTVVVAAPEGDMIKYCQSLQKVIDLHPSVIIPSHGIAMGGTLSLQKTLQHRRMREEQIFTLLQQGRTTLEIMDELYGGLPEVLRQLGLCNIESHIRKLKAEGRLSEV